MQKKKTPGFKRRSGEANDFKILTVYLVLTQKEIIQLYKTCTTTNTNVAKKRGPQPHKEQTQLKNK